MNRFPSFGFNFTKIRQHWRSLPDYETAKDYLDRVERQYAYERAQWWRKDPNDLVKGYTSTADELREDVMKRVAEVFAKENVTEYYPVGLLYAQHVRAHTAIAELLEEKYGGSELSRCVIWRKSDQYYQFNAGETLV